MQHALRSACLVLALSAGACDGPSATDAGTDAGPSACASGALHPLRWSQSSAGLVGGSHRDLFVELARDCNREVVIALTLSAPGIVEVPATVAISADESRAYVRITALSEGVVTLTATASHEPTGDVQTATLEVAVVASTLPACEGTAEGTAAPGGELAVSSGTLAGAAIRVPAGAARDDRYHVDPIAARIECADDLAIDGYRALGPAVRFDPEHLRLSREIQLSVPLRLALLPPGANRGDVEIAYLAPHHSTPRIVAIASPRFSGTAGDGAMVFEVPRLGTYQAVTREDPPGSRMRRFNFRGILGFSMGGSGSGRIGLGNPDLFDFVAPLGGPTDWTYMLEHIRRYHVGGFCTEAERAADPAGCAAGASLDRVPPTTQLHEHPQHFEHWWYDDGYDGQGGTFDRTDYISIFRDLAAMFGNPNHDASADPSAPNIAPPGLPESIRTLPDSQRCAPENRVVIPPYDGTAGTGFFDDEYNPEGTYPVIHFCDGAQTGDIGQWDPTGGQNMAIEVVVAVDIDGDGVRDPGEPVIRNGREPFEDVGLDGVRSEDEVSPDGAAYDAMLNPDPAGDDFDFQYNPSGTENNWQRDAIDGDACRAAEVGIAEAFDDVGIDGVAGTAQLADGGFDSGEGNGCFDRARGARRMIESSPRWLAEHMDEARLRDLDVLADGGIRDLFNWVVMGNVTMAGWSARGLPVRFYNDHAALHLEGRPNGAFDFETVPWDEIGQYAMVRYGDPDTEERFIEIGDGGHVGTTLQLTQRLNSGLAMMSSRWPDGDRRRVLNDRICTAASMDCSYVNSFVFDFTASTGRTGPVSVVLPPGYFFEENRDVRYPVVYFLHGYGMSPEDLIALGLLMWQSMNSPRVNTERRMQKMILVFPDGRCRGGECLRGTFYTDAPESTPGGARMQTFLLDLIEHIDASYRTRAPEAFEVPE